MLDADRLPQGLRERFEHSLSARESRHHYPLPTTPQSGAPEDLFAQGGQASLYVHVPFCTERCTYCFFVTQIGHGAADMARYVQEVAREIELVQDKLGAFRFTSLYYGGGTPGLLPPQIFLSLHKLIAPLLAPDATITVETHPHAADEHRIEAWRSVGVDRVSMGVQTLDAELLKLVNREHTAKLIRPAAELLLQSGFDDVNVDLLYGLPQQPMESWLDALAVMVQAGLPSISIYRTAFIPHTLAAFDALGAAPPPADLALAMYQEGFSFLNASGYQQPRYGCSTFSRKAYPYGLNRHRQHILAGLPMVGLGMGAYGSVGDYVYLNQRTRGGYQRDLEAGRLPVLSAQAVPSEERPYKYAVETWKSGFFASAAYRARFGENPEARFGPELAALVEWGELEHVDDEYRLTPMGARHPDAIASMFLSPAALTPAAAKGA